MPGTRSSSTDLSEPLDNPDALFKSSRKLKNKALESDNSREDGHFTDDSDDEQTPTNVRRMSTTEGTSSTAVPITPSVPLSVPQSTPTSIPTSIPVSIPAASTPISQVQTSIPATIPTTIPTTIPAPSTVATPFVLEPTSTSWGQFLSREEPPRYHESTSSSAYRQRSNQGWNDYVGTSTRPYSANTFQTFPNISISTPQQQIHQPYQPLTHYQQPFPFQTQAPPFQFHPQQLQAQLVHNPTNNNLRGGNEALHMDEVEEIVDNQL